MSATSERILSDNIKKSFTNFEELTLAQYTPESVQERLSKGEDVFFTKSGLENLKAEIQKGENSPENGTLISNTLKKLEKVSISKGDESYFGYFLQKEG